MRKALVAIFVSISLMALAIYLVRVDNIHIRSQEDAAHYQMISEIGTFLLFTACLVFLGITIAILRKLRPLNILFAGLLLLASAALVWAIVMSVGVSVHSWTFFLLVPPIIFGLSSLLLILGGSIRFLVGKISLKSN